jgi:hypothetical protein
MPASPPYAAPSQFDATQFHSEFGYLAPTIRFRRKVALTLKGGALGALVGAVAVFVVVTDREEKAFTMLSTPVLTIPASPAPVLAMPMSSKPGSPAREPSTPATSVPGSLTPAQVAAINSARVRFVPEALALPAAVPADPHVRGPAPPVVAVGPLDLVLRGSVIAAAPVAKPKKKIVREPQPERIVRPAPAEPGSRSAYAAESSVPRFLRSIFGL